VSAETPSSIQSRVAASLTEPGGHGPERLLDNGPANWERRPGVCRAVVRRASGAAPPLTVLKHAGQPPQSTCWATAPRPAVLLDLQVRLGIEPAVAAPCSCTPGVSRLSVGFSVE